MSDINGVMMQAFHWYTPGGGRHWDELAARAQDLASVGFTGLWLPPACKCLEGRNSVGYSIYDLYDLGEFDQKGSIPTKYGTRDQYLNAIRSLQASNIQVYADTVLNHRIGGDLPETVNAVPYRQNDRLNPFGPPREIRTYTHFTFPGRKGKYSNFEWRWHHFDAVDYDEISHTGGTIYLFEGKRFDDQVALENGNFAYLLGCDLDFQNDDVRREIFTWGKWYMDTTGADGLRLDAIKHIAAWFFPAWVDELERHTGRDLFFVGEYWAGDIRALHWYLDVMGARMSIFDVPLHYNFHTASRSGGSYDMRCILDNTLMQQRPVQAVTFVENHDSQPLQALESPVDTWFKPLAYAVILLRREGYPCVFMADYDGAEYIDRGRDGNSYEITMEPLRPIIDILLKARRGYAYGDQYDYFDHWDIVGWTRLGDDEHSRAMAVIMSDGPGGTKWMAVNRPGARFTDITGHSAGTVETNEHGWGEFRCQGGSVSVWVQE